VLVLTRHVHQSIVIGHDVVVTVLEVRGDQVRLGITAPKRSRSTGKKFRRAHGANRQAPPSASNWTRERAEAPQVPAKKVPIVSMRGRAVWAVVQW